MASVTKRMRRAAGPEDRLPPLENGDHLDQATFHARYEAMPEHVSAELIGGIVYMNSRLKRRHGRTHATLMGWLWTYEAATSRVEAYDNTTTILGSDSEPQPDGCLVVSTECGGKMRFTADEYLEGAPELLAEIASSTQSIDLHAKKTDYERAGVREYLVIALHKATVFWFIARQGTFEELPPGPDGILRSETFPGLWLDPAALLRHDSLRLLDVLRQGLATKEHAAFLKKLASRRRRK